MNPTDAALAELDTTFRQQLAQAAADLVLAAPNGSASGLTWGRVSIDNGDGSVMVRPAGSDADVGPVWVLGSAV